VNALLLFASTFALALFLGLQSLNVIGGYRLLLLLICIDSVVANLAVFKIIPSLTNGLEAAAVLLGGFLGSSFGIFASIAIHPLMVRALGRRNSSTHQLPKRTLQ